MQCHRGSWHLGAKVTESRGVWLKASRRRERLRVGSGAALSPSPTKTERLGEPPSSPFTCPTAPSRLRTTPSGQAAFTRSEGSHPHKGALCLSAPGRAAWERGTAPRQGRSPPPRSIERPSPSTPRLNDGAPLGLPQLAPQRQAQELGGAQATPKKFALPPHCALHASRPLERLSTPRPRLPAHPITGPETRSPPPGPAHL